MTFQQNENEGGRNNGQISGLYRRTEKAVEHKGDIETKCSWQSLNDPQRPWKVTKKIGDQRRNREHTDNITVKIGYNT